MGILYGVARLVKVVIGAIMIGGVHDLVALFASVRERGLDGGNRPQDARQTGFCSSASPRS
jgi:hypothetical protein